MLPFHLPACYTSDSRGGEGRPTRVGWEQGLSHCQTPRQRTPSASAWWASVLCLLPPGGEGRYHQPEAAAQLHLPPHSSPAGQGAHRGTAGARLIFSVGGLSGILSTPGAGESCFSPALGGFGGRVLILLCQGEEVAKPEGQEHELSERASGPLASFPSPLPPAWVLISPQPPGLTGH